MSDEEKKALKRIDYIQDFIIENGQYNADVNDMEYFSRIKNLIEKQSKEIEELKDESKEYQIGFAQGCYEKDLDWKDKIKAKIEEVEQWELYNMKIPKLSTLDERLGAKIGIKYVLQSLLNEEE